MAAWRPEGSRRAPLPRARPWPAWPSSPSRGCWTWGLSVWEAPRPLAFWPVWEAVGRLIFHLLLAGGLLRRLAFCRFVALVYCLAALATYGVVLVLAVADAPLDFPNSVVLGSLFQVPSSVVLLPWLRSANAQAWFRRPFFGP